MATCRKRLEPKSSLTWSIEGYGVIFEWVEETIKQLMELSASQIIRVYLVYLLSNYH